MNQTGIGFAGLEGVWWLPAREAFPLPIQVAQELTEIGRALFLLFDTLITLYKDKADDGLIRLLETKVPEHIPRLVGEGRVDSVRPDFQLLPVIDSRTGRPVYRLVITELEICPSAHGFAHAMQVGYGLETDLAQGFAEFLKGRDLLFVGSSDWSAFLFEQLAFCQALAERGARGRVLYDRPITAIADDVRRRKQWQTPMFGIPEKPATWNDDILGRIQANGFEPFLWPDETGWPEDTGRSVVFRFGYFDNFSPDRLCSFQRWQERGATILNPATFFLDSKAVMSALGLTSVRRVIATARPAALTVLDRCIPETILLDEENLVSLVEEKDGWALKYAGFDGGNQAWGGRSLQLGLNHSEESWRTLLRQYSNLPWPVVAQRAVPSARVDIGYVDGDGSDQVLRAGRTRLRSFLLRIRGADNSQDDKVIACGSHITVSGGSMGVSEGIDAVQAPVVFQD